MVVRAQPRLDRRGLALTLACLCTSGACSTSHAGEAAPDASATAEDARPVAALRPVERRGPIPRDARIADYTIDAALDAETHRVTGTVRLTWRNRTTRTTSELPGVPPTERAKLFEPFYTTVEEGTGLGLYLCKELCEINNATLTYRPTEDDDSCFRMAILRPA